MTIIRNGRVIRGDVIENAEIAFENGKIVPVPANTDGAEIIDAAGKYVSPGFVDIHTHGGGGADFLDNTVEAFLTAAKLHAQHGTTTLLPTATSSTPAETVGILAVSKEAAEVNTVGADMPGIHFEGPYFSPVQCGAQDPKMVRPPDPAEYEKILSLSDRIMRWSAAPELEGSHEFAAALREHGVLPAIGHSNADYDEVVQALGDGYTHITHLYSCCSTVHRRNAYRYAGIVEAAYLLDDITVEIIADGAHLPPPLLQQVYRFIGPDRTALVTDSMRGAGMTSGESIMGSLESGHKVIIEDGVAKLPDRSAFAGSVATMDRLVKNMVTLAKATLTDTVKMAATTPARIMGLTDRGTLEVGKRADIVLFDDEFRVSRTIVAGHTVYEG